LLTDRWTIFKHHPVQYDLWTSKNRFKAVPAGRRSGKTEIAKRKIVIAALSQTKIPDARFICAAPVQHQAKSIYWRDIKALIPPQFIRKKSESELTIDLITGTRIQVVGMDKPERIEGTPIDGIILDEFANMKPTVWTENVRPGLSTPDRPPGWAWFIGVPEGRNHYYRIYKKACERQDNGWGGYHWNSEDILDPEEIAQAKEDLDELTYAQEYQGSFVNFEGRVYYSYDTAVHAVEKLEYNPALPLIFCFDFNVSPGVAVVCQEQVYGGDLEYVDDTFTAVLGEVYIPKNSTTPKVCAKLIKDWGPEGKNHQGEVWCYGDASGGAKGSAKVQGSDWDLIRAHLKGTWEIGDKLIFRVKKSNPSERSRVNSVNSRLMSSTNKVRLLVDPRCKYISNDLDSVVTLKGGSGEIDKDIDKDLTHSSDALGYYIHYKFPIGVGIFVAEAM
jgi:hypothetical protein